MDLQTNLLELARVVESEQQLGDEARALWADDLKGKNALSNDESARLHGIITRLADIRAQRAWEIRQAADESPQTVAVILYRAARGLLTGKHDAPELLEQAVAALRREAASPKVRLSTAEQDIVDVISEAGGTVGSQTEILNALAAKGKIPSEGTTKTTLAALVRHGILKTGPGGKGYCLP